MNNRRKELLEQYKRMKPEMGIFWVRSKGDKKCFLETSQNLKGRMNRTRFQLDAGNHPNQELQREWKQRGADHFEFEILELLPYAKDESKTDYTEELSIMKMLWEEKLSEQQFAFYQKK